MCCMQLKSFFLCCTVNTNGICTSNSLLSFEGQLCTFSRVLSLLGRYCYNMYIVKTCLKMFEIVFSFNVKDIDIFQC